jgi:hypothetical protein
MGRYQPTYYFVDEYRVPTLPALVIYDTHLDIDVDYDGDIYISAIAMRDDNDKVVRFIKGDWLFDLLAHNIYDDDAMMELIYKEASLDND